MSSNTKTVHLMHASMQFSDTPKQMAHDAEAILDRASRRNVAWITGTEAGPAADPLADLLAKESRANRYRLFKPSGTDGWIAVDRDQIHGGWETHYEKLVDGVAKRWGPKGVVAVGFDSERFGCRINVTTSHLLTKGRPDAKDPQYRQFLAQNQTINDGLAVYARKVGKGRGLVFYGGDQNIVDRNADTFLGGPFTSAWDELGKYENTGHGNIDVIASYDHDRRVSAKYVRALDDKEFFLHTDHFLVEAGFEIVLPNVA